MPACMSADPYTGNTVYIATPVAALISILAWPLGNKDALNFFTLYGVLSSPIDLNRIALNKLCWEKISNLKPPL